MKQIIKQLIKKHVKTDIDDIALEIPPNSNFGDYAFPCFKLTKEFKKSPQDIAYDIAEKLLKKLPEEIKDVQVKGPYVNFFVNPEFLVKKILTKIYKEKDKYHLNFEDNKTILIEYSAPNTNKPQHLGHIRNNLIGMALSKLIETQGYKVIKLNWINDRGIHICKSMLAYKKWGNNKTPKSENKKPDHFVGDFYVKFSKEAKKHPELEQEAQEMLKKWENGDKETIRLWKKMNKWAYKGFRQTYEELGCKFDKWYYESKIFENGKKLVLESYKKKILVKDEQGNIIADLEKYNLGKKVLLRADGTSIYSTADLSLAIEKSKCKPYKSLYVVGSEQNHYLKQMFKIFEMLGLKKYALCCEHVSYGMIFLPEGKMKSREGTVVDADDLMQEMIDEAKSEIKKRHKNLTEKKIDKRAKIIGLGALKFFILKYDAQKNFTFIPKESISFEGETGPYIQYVHARICSILRKYKKEDNKKPTIRVNFSKLNHEIEVDLIKLLSQFPDKVKESSDKYKPHIIARYLIELAQKFNLFYLNCPVLSNDKELTEARILLINSIKQIIVSGMKLLGIDVPEEM